MQTFADTPCNGPFYSCILNYLAFAGMQAKLKVTLHWYRPLRFFRSNANYLAREKLDLHNKSGEICIKTGSPSYMTRQVIK